MSDVEAADPLSSQKKLCKDFAKHCKLMFSRRKKKKIEGKKKKEDWLNTIVPVT